VGVDENRGGSRRVASPSVDAFIAVEARILVHKRKHSSKAVPYGTVVEKLIESQIVKRQDQPWVYLGVAGDRAGESAQVALVLLAVARFFDLNVVQAGRWAGRRAGRPADGGLSRTVSSAVFVVFACASCGSLGKLCR